MRKNTPLRVEKRLRPWVPWDGNRVSHSDEIQGGPKHAKSCNGHRSTPHMRKTPPCGRSWYDEGALPRLVAQQRSMKTRRQNRWSCFGCKTPEARGTSGNIRVDIELCYGLPCPEST